MLRAQYQLIPATLLLTKVYELQLKEFVSLVIIFVFVTCDTEVIKKSSYKILFFFAFKNAEINQILVMCPTFYVKYSRKERDALEKWRFTRSQFCIKH